MASAAEIRVRINSVSDTKKVTDAMYMISSVKMRKARTENEKVQPYFIALREEIGELLHYIPENSNRYYQILDDDGIQGRALLLITSDKGLNGSYNHTAIKAAEERIRKYPDTLLFVVGEYGRQYFGHKNARMADSFRYAASFPTTGMAQKICNDLLEYYNSDRVDEIDIIYTHYQAGKPILCKERCLLPLNGTGLYDSNDFEITFGKEYLPDPHTVLNEIVPSYLTGFIYSALVESYCSEQEARMTAMHTAGTNADEMLKKLKMEYNSVRQAAITREMTEITSGTKALLAKHRKKAKEGGKNERRNPE